MTLYICNPKQNCPICKNHRRRRRKCEPCKRTGYAPISFEGAWAPQPGFLVCGGPSLRDLDLERLQDRGVMSVGVNNAAAYARTSAMVFGDSQWKFHSSLFFDPKCMLFCPNGKLTRRVRMQDSKTGHFYFSSHQIKDCPSVYGICRSGRFYDEGFFTSWYAYWGKGGKMEVRVFTRLETMLIGLRVLHYLGCRTIYLLGVDFWMTKEDAYAWDAERSGGNRRWMKAESMLEDVKKQCPEAGVEIFNCSPQTKSQAFPYRSYDDALEHASRPFGKAPYDLSQWYGMEIQRQQTALHPDPVANYVT